MGLSNQIIENMDNLIEISLTTIKHYVKYRILTYLPGMEPVPFHKIFTPGN